jgi:hypothetical protein
MKYSDIVFYPILVSAGLVSQLTVRDFFNNEPTERPGLLAGVYHLRGIGLFRRRQAFKASSFEPPFARYKGIS